MTEESMGPESQRQEPERHLAEVLRALRSAHFDPRGVACDYASLAGSKERGRLAASLAELESFDPGRVRIAGQTAFWINVFNAGVLRDAPELEHATGEHDMQGFFERPRLKLFGHRFSLDDIHHGLLRGNLPKHGRLRGPMGRDDPRRAYMPIAYDERMHLAGPADIRARQGGRPARRGRHRLHPAHGAGGARRRHGRGA
jgi:Protein of unknown function, DUF547